jgi:hypothetical protein
MSETPTTGPSPEQIEVAQLLLVENASALKEEAELLLNHGRFARAYLLAHLGSEELAKGVLLARVMKALKDAKAPSQTHSDGSCRSLGWDRRW